LKVSLESIGKADAFNSKSERLTLSTSSQHGAPACGPEKHISPASFRRVDMKTLVELERGIFNFLEFDITRCVCHVFLLDTIVTGLLQIYFLWTLTSQSLPLMNVCPALLVPCGSRNAGLNLFRSLMQRWTSYVTSHRSRSS